MGAPCLKGHRGKGKGALGSQVREPGGEVSMSHLTTWQVDKRVNNAHIHWEQLPRRRSADDSTPLLTPGPLPLLYRNYVKSESCKIIPGSSRKSLPDD